MRTPSALDDIKVLDLCDQTGAYCGKLLAEMGADVVLVEPPGGSPMRHIGPFHPDATDAERSEASLFFWHYNTNKRGITLDLDSDAGLQKFRQLVAGADLIIESFPPGYLTVRQLSYADLAALNPGVVLTSITPFGQTGPYRDFRASDIVSQALGGLAYVNGLADAEPLQGVGLPAYHAAAMWAAIGSLLALFDRQRTGRGQWVDVGTHACAVATLEHATSLYRANGEIARRTGGVHWTRAFRIGPCRDGYIAHGLTGDWTTLAEWVTADLEDDDLKGADWNDPAYRRDNSDRLFDVLDRWAADKSAISLAAAAQLRRLPYAALQPLEAALANPQLRARRFFVPVEYDAPRGSLHHPAAPYVFGQSPRQPPRRAPHLGEHDHEVLAVARGQKEAEIPLDGVPSPPYPSLEGLRVLDFTWAVAGPLASRILADQGADVVKVEGLGVRRETTAPVEMNLNRGKRSIALDMSQPRGVALARQLVAACDVVIDNFSPRVMRNWGLDDDSLRRQHPRLISIGMSGFGADGPLCDRVSYGPTLQAAAGHSLRMSQRGLPAGWGFSYADTVAGHTAALAIIIALWQRRRTDTGQRIDLSQFETLIAVSGPALLAMQIDGAEPPGNDTQESDAAPHGIYRCSDEPDDGPCADRWCAIAVFGDADWRRLVTALGSPPWTADARFDTHAGRWRDRAEIDEQLSRWTREQRAEDVMQRLQQVGIAAGLVANARDLCERDPQLRQRGYWVSLNPDARQPAEVDGVPLLRHGRPVRTLSPPPRVGEHTDAVLATLLNLDRPALDELRRDRVVA